LSQRHVAIAVEVVEHRVITYGGIMFPSVLLISAKPPMPRLEPPVVFALSALAPYAVLELQVVRYPEKLEDNHDNDNYSDYVKDASVHARDHIKVSV
jgi:hypothetical protein